MRGGRHIRNFSIIAHIDHGKSTLADRLIQMCGGLSAREMKEQVLDSMELERERGITIKAQTARLEYVARNGTRYQLNLIDTPGHVDFAYEVSRSLAACEGSLLLVDASQGVEAQSLANAYQAIAANHEIIPVLNKIDLPAAEPRRAREQIAETIGLDAEDAVEISAKSGAGVEALLEALVSRLPPPGGDDGNPLQAMVVDSWYDPYIGVVVLTRVMEGVLRRGMRVRLLSTGADWPVEEVGVFRPKKEAVEALRAGEIGCFTAAIKQASDVRVGDTICDVKHPRTPALPGFREAMQVVFCGFFPLDSGEFAALKEACARLRLNDASFFFEVESSAALGFGFRCGFLGLLHMEIVRDRIEREHGIALLTTAPSVIYRVFLTDGEMRELHNPADLPPPERIAHMEEPWARISIFTPEEYLGAVMKLCEERRGRQKEMSYLGGRVVLEYELPLSEMMLDFYDRLKSVTRGYAGFDYHVRGYERGDLTRMDILVNGEAVDALSTIVHRSAAFARGRGICEKLKGLIPRHLFKVPIQAAIGGRIIARETIAALRKDVTAKCYGGDVSRKRKLLEKQKAGKRKMRAFGKVEIPQEAFLRALRLGDE